jgi:hypothetical protein
MEAAKSATPVVHHYASCGLRAPVSSRRAADRAEVVGAEPLAARGSTIEKFDSPIEIIVMPGVNQPRAAPMQNERMVLRGSRPFVGHLLEG